MIKGKLYKAYNSGRIYRYDGEINGWNVLTIVECGPGDKDYMKNRKLEYRGICPPFLTELTDD